MDDAVLESSHHTFDRILLSLFSLSLMGGLAAWLHGGLASPWVLRAEKLLLLVLIVLILHWLKRFTSAITLLILGLLGLAIELLFQGGSLSNFAPYLLIPVVIIASLMFSARTTVIFALFAVVALMVATVITKPFSLTALSGLLPPSALILLTALLATLNRRQLVKLNQRYAENKTLLQQRTRELVKFQEEMKSLQTKLADLDKALTQAKTEAGQARRQSGQKDQQLHNLIKGTVQESKAAVKRLEDVLGGMASASNGSRTHFFNEAWQGIDHLASLVTSLEEIIGLEQEEFKLEYQATDIGQLLADLVSSMRGLAHEKQLQLRYTPAPNLPSLSADPVRLRQALLQILGNALKYTDQGVVEIQTELTERELVIFVSDTGVGMPAETLATLFQPVAPAQAKAGPARRGPGLGLKLAKRLIELHRGRIWANSIKGVGSTFCVALPLRSPEDMLEATMLSPARLPRRSAAHAPAKTIPAAAAKAPVQTSRADAPAPKKETPPAPVPARGAHFGPVARYSPLYISRFGLILMGLLMAVLGLVICLAFVNGPVLPPATPTVLIQLPVSPTLVAQTTATEPAALALKPSSTPSPSQTATTTPNPTATTAPTFAASLPTQAERVQPTATLSPTITPLRALSVVEKVQLTPTLTPTPTSTFAPTFTPSPTSAPTQAPQPATAPPPVTPLNVAFVAEQSAGLGLTLIQDTSGSLLAQTQGESNGRASWAGSQGVLSLMVAGERDLYLLRPGQTQPLNLTASPGDDWQPAWSPAGQKIAFSSGRGGNLDIYVMNQSGGPALPLTTSRGYDEWPVWSPDGTKIAFVSDRDGNVEIYVMNSDGSNQQRLTDHPADDWPTAWSPDGRRLVFASNRDGNWNLYLVDSTGANLNRLTNDPGDEREPVWSPDGRIIAFAATGSGNWDIYSLPAPGSIPAETPRSAWTQLTATPVDERYPAWLNVER